MERPPGKHDPLTLAVLGGAAALLAALVLYVIVSDRPRPETSGETSIAERARQQLSELAADFEADVRHGRKTAKSESAPAARAPEPHGTVSRPAGGGAVAKSGPPVATAAKRNSESLLPPAGKTWVYVVTLEPPLWREATLEYRTMLESGSLSVHTNFRHANGQMKFRLGSFVPGHASHANVRFPGFFLYAAYLEFPFVPGQSVAWGWPWQLPDGRVKDGRTKRYQGKVAGWENVQVPAGTYEAARIEATLEYIDDGRVRASVRETLWIAPQVTQVVKVVREGRSPDEGAQRIVAELADFR